MEGRSKGDLVWISDAEGGSMPWRLVRVVDPVQSVVQDVKNWKSKHLPLDSLAKDVVRPVSKSLSTVRSDQKVVTFSDEHLRDWTQVLRMTDLNQAALLHLLKRRYDQDIIYTFAGDVLISLNPYKDVGSFPQQVDFSRGLGKVTKCAYDALMDREKHHKGKSQSVCINGESGSGKTEAAKYVMRVLAKLSADARAKVASLKEDQVNSGLRKLGMGMNAGSSKKVNILGRGRGRGRGSRQSSSSPTPPTRSAPSAPPPKKDFGDRVEQAFVNANPVLETFGNAKTVNNLNSSRFGKYVQVNFDDDGVVYGAKTSHFFLEKTRLVGHGKSERNFHVFYALVATLKSPKESGYKDLARFIPNKGYAYLAYKPKLGWEADEWEDVEDDLNRWKECCDALSVVDLGDRIREISEFLLGVLTLGNLKFSESEDRIASLTSHNTFKLLSYLFSCSNVETLERALAHRTIEIANETTEIPLSKVEAKENCDALAKHLYDKLFCWLVEKINLNSSDVHAEAKQRKVRKSPIFVGVLDIFGFEILRNSTFEQLCVNYTNEIMQQMFDSHVFSLEIELMEEEGIDWKSLKFRDNEDVLKLFSWTSQPLGIFQTLDEQGMLGDRATDENFLKTIRSNQKDVSAFVPLPDRHRTHKFSIKHNAGTVTYDARKILKKNADSLQSNLLDALAETSSQLLSELLVLDSNADAANNNANDSLNSTRESLSRLAEMEEQASFSKRRMAKLNTVSARFRSQLLDLRARLDHTENHFVRCVLPNKKKKPSKFDFDVVHKQLSYLSVHEMVRIRREGYPVRMSFGELMDVVGQALLRVCGSEYKHVVGVNDSKCCEAMLNATLGAHSYKKLWQAGTTRIFMKDGVLESLKIRLMEIERASSVRIQSTFRGFLARKRAEKRRKAAAVLTRFAAAKLFRKKRKAQHEAAIKIQALVKMHSARSKFAKLKKITVEIQRKFRTKCGKHAKAVEKIKAFLKMIPKRRNFKVLRAGMVKLQAAVRGALVRPRYESVKSCRDEWDKYLSDNEAIVLSSLVIKTSEMHVVKSVSNMVSRAMTSKRRRQLLLTTKPRLIYVDPSSRKLKGEIPVVRDETGAFAVSAVDFVIHSRPTENKKDKTEWNFCDLLGPAVCWVKSIANPLTVFDLVAREQRELFEDEDPPLMRGVLTMKSVSPSKDETDAVDDKHKNYRQRFHVIKGRDFWWYDAPGQTLPTGGANLTPECSIVVRDNCKKKAGLPNLMFELHTPYVKIPIKFRVHDQNALERWVEALSKAIEQTKRLRGCSNRESEESALRSETGAQAVVEAQRHKRHAATLFNCKDYQGAKAEFFKGIKSFGFDRATWTEGEKVVVPPRVLGESKLMLFLPVGGGPTLQACLGNLSETFIRMKEGERAVNTCTFIISKAPRNEKAYLRRAVGHELLGDKDSALRDLDAVLSFKPNLVEASVMRERLLTSSRTTTPSSFSRQNSFAFGTGPDLLSPGNAVRGIMFADEMGGELIAHTDINALDARDSRTQQSSSSEPRGSGLEENLDQTWEDSIELETVVEEEESSNKNNLDDVFEDEDDDDDEDDDEYDDEYKQVSSEEEDDDDEFDAEQEFIMDLSEDVRVEEVEEEEVVEDLVTPEKTPVFTDLPVVAAVESSPPSPPPPPPAAAAAESRVTRRKTSSDADMIMPETKKVNAAPVVVAADDSAPENVAKKKKKKKKKSSFAAVALAAYKPSQEGDLAFAKGERIRVTKVYKDGWAKGKTSDGRGGIFPASYVQMESGSSG